MPRRPGASPWTVITQGRSLNYDDATLLDKLEYVVHSGSAAALSRTLSQPGFAVAVIDALGATVVELEKADVLLRAGELLGAVVDWGAAEEGRMAAVIGALPGGLGPFVEVIGHGDKDVAGVFAGSVGKVLGAKDIDVDGRAFVGKLCGLLENVGKGEGVGVVLDGPDSSSDIVAEISSGIGAEYIPTVSGIVADMQTGGGASGGDETLGRLLSGLAAFLGKEENRDVFCEKVNGRAGPALLTAMLGRDMRLPVQAKYQAVFCLWLLSFPKQTLSNDESSVVANALEAAEAPRLLTAVVREVSAEKVVRISLATLRNLMQMSTTLRKEMIGAGLVAALQSLCMRQWNDVDINDDLQVLASSLDSELASMSTFDVYRAEVLSGALEWTPPHRDDMFWRENVEKMDTNNMEILRCMVRLLNDSADTTVLCVACHDLAQFVKYHPRGRYITQSLGVKGRLMELMSEGDSEVRRYALNTVQVLMISNWNLMQRVS